MRDFRDSKGVQWVVWSTIPWAATVLDSFRGGWLTFVSQTSRRRLIPIPTGWEDASPAHLESLCAMATDVRRTPASGTDRVDVDAR